MARAVLPGARHWPLADLVLASALWGCAIAGTKYAMRAFNPVTLLSVERVAATAALWAVVLLSASLYSVVAKRFAGRSR
jgi:hypothetical protein